MSTAIDRFIRFSFFFSFVIALFSGLFSASAHAAKTPIGAKAVFVEGEVTILSVKDSSIHKVKIGTEFSEGDRVKTGSDGVVEIEFDTGDLIRVDRDTDMAIKALNRDEEGSTFSVFNLIVGRVKSAVSKLATSGSKFEYHTKAAICGVAGTPPFVVQFRKNQTFVDLLGKKGEPGKVYVRGFDPGQTLVNVFSGHRTTVRPGAPPLKPFAISPSRLRNLNRTIPFKSALKKKKEAPAPSDEKAPAREDEEKPAEKQAEKSADKQQDVSPDTKPPAPPPGGSVEEKMVINTLSRSVSVPRQTAPEKSRTVEGVESQTTQDQGIIGQKTQSGGESAPPVTSTTIDVIIDLK